jgi:chorismate-pyruvate lyase
MSAAVQPGPSATVLDLHERLLANASATAVLRELFGAPVLIRRVPGRSAAPDQSHAALLAVARPAEIVHRHVVLHAGGRAVSEADLFYVPGRLWPGMAETLATSDVPFGTVVSPMQPVRETTAARVCALDEAYALEHRAVLRDAFGAPIAAVHERYFRLL